MRTYVAWILIGFFILTSVISCTPKSSDCPAKVEEHWSIEGDVGIELVERCRDQPDALRAILALSLRSAHLASAESVLASLERSGRISQADYQEVAYHFLKMERWHDAASNFAKALKLTDDNVLRLGYAIALQNSADQELAIQQYSLLRHRLTGAKSVGGVLEEGGAYDDINSAIKYEALVRYSELLIASERFEESHQVAQEAIDYDRYGGDAYYLRARATFEQVGCSAAREEILRDVKLAQEYGLDYVFRIERSAGKLPASFCDGE